MGGIGNGRLISIMDLKIKHILGGRGGTGSRCSKTLCSTLFLEFECWDLELERMGWGRKWTGVLCVPTLPWSTALETQRERESTESFLCAFWYGAV